MEYKVLLDTKDQLFTAVDVKNQNIFGNGRTVKAAVDNLKKKETSKKLA